MLKTVVLLKFFEENLNLNYIFLEFFRILPTQQMDKHMVAMSMKTLCIYAYFYTLLLHFRWEKKLWMCDDYLSIQC